MDVGTFAKRIAETERAEKKIIDEAFLGGLLHDVGKLILAANLPAQFKQAISISREKNILLHDAEMELFSTSHAEMGGYLMGLWGLPDSIIESIIFHHNPNNFIIDDFSPVTAVHAANVLAHENNYENPAECLHEIDNEYLSKIGLMDKISLWREKCCLEKTAMA